MELEHLRISQNPSYHSRPGEYTGNLKFKGAHGEVEIPLDNALSREVLKLCAESLARATKDIAQNLTASVFENAGLPAIENKDG